MTVAIFFLLGAAFLKIILGNEENMTFGVTDDVTPGTLLSNYVLPPPEDMTYMSFFSTEKCDEPVTCKNMDSLPPENRNLNYMNCRCDEECLLYNDCCLDAPVNNNTGTIESIFECVTLPDHIYVYMVTSCPTSFRDPETVHRCKSIATEEDLKFDLRMDIPVTDLTTNITYANIYCAKCSSVDENSENIAYWSTDMYCKFVYSSLTARVKHVVPSNTTHNNRVLILDNGLYENCSVKLVVSEEAKSRIRYCVPSMIDSCSRTNVYQNSSKSCNGNMQYVIAHGLFFRNIYCAKCLSIRKEEISICPIIKYGVVHNRVKRMVLENDTSEYEDTTDSYNATYNYDYEDYSNAGEDVPFRNDLISGDARRHLRSQRAIQSYSTSCAVPFSCYNFSIFPDSRKNPYANCYCDTQCSTNNDCCPDVPPYTLHNSTVKSECVETEFGTYVRMIVSCPEEWKDDIVFSKCVSFTQQGDLSHDVPLTDLRTNYTYANAFCAECNGARDDRKNLVPWTTHLNCSFSYTTINDRLKYIRFDKEEGRWKIEFEEHACRVSSLVPTKVISSRIRRCLPTISSCNPKWNDSEVSERCANYTTFIFSTFLKHIPIPNGDSYQWIATYRNKDCAKCNYQLESNLTYCPISRAEAKLAPFHLLFKPPFPVVRNDPKVYGQSLNMIYEWEDDSYLPKSTVTFLGISISIIFLTFHLVIFFKVKELQNLSGKCLTSYSAALIIGYISFLFWDFIEWKLCSTIALISYYGFLSVFLWMFAMSYDVFISTYNATLKFSRSSNRNKYKKFIKYSFACWGSPLIIILLFLLIDFKSFGMPQPGFGQGVVCWFGDATSMMYYFVIPCFTILVLNAVFFLLTSYMIFINRKSPNSSKKNNSYIKFLLYGRLAILMGLTWIVAAFAFAFNDNELWTLFTVLNTTQGIFIFFSFSFRKSVWRTFLSKLKDKQGTLQSSFETQFTNSTVARTEEIEIK